MDTPQNADLTKLLGQLDVTTLGEGNADIGANVLVAMFITLANIARQGSGLVDSFGAVSPVGCSLMVSGGQSASLIQDSVVTEAAICQNNLIPHLIRLMQDKIEDARKQGTRMVEFPSGPPDNDSTNSLFQLEQTDNNRMNDVTEQWRHVVSQRPNPRLDDLQRSPKILVTTQNPRDLEKQLVGVHLDRATIFIALNTAKDVAAFSDICNGILNGVLPSLGGLGILSGNILLIDPCNIVAEVAPVAASDAQWLGRLVWLLDGEDDFKHKIVMDRSAERADGQIAARFCSSMHQAFAKRLNNVNANPERYQVRLMEAQEDWVEFLRKMEPSLPGITGTARRLLATLTFGLLELSKAPDLNPINELHLRGVLPLCKYLVRRMAE